MSTTAAVAIERGRSRNAPPVVTLSFIDGTIEHIRRALIQINREAKLSSWILRVTVISGVIRVCVLPAYTAQAREFIERIGREVLA